MSNDKGHILVVITCILFSITIFSAALRTFTRLRLLRWMGVDDMLISIAAVAAIPQAVCNIIAAQNGLGTPLKDQLPEERVRFMKAEVASTLSYTISATLVKLSLLAFYLRLSPNPTFKILTWTMIFISGASGLAFTLVNAVQCRPLSVLWGDNSGNLGQCIEIIDFQIANAAIHIATEVAIYVLPVPTLWSLKLPVRQKIGLCILMGIGALLIVISALRIYAITGAFRSSGITMITFYPQFFFTLELNLAIFIACGPAYLAFFRHYIPSVFGAGSNRSTYATARYDLRPPYYALKHVSRSRATTREGPFSENRNDSVERMI